MCLKKNFFFATSTKYPYKEVFSARIFLNFISVTYRSGVRVSSRWFFLRGQSAVANEISKSGFSPDFFFVYMSLTFNIQSRCRVLMSFFNFLSVTEICSLRRAWLLAFHPWLRRIIIITLGLCHASLTTRISATQNNKLLKTMLAFFFLVINHFYNLFAYSVDPIYLLLYPTLYI